MQTCIDCGWPLPCDCEPERSAGSLERVVSWPPEKWIKLVKESGMKLRAGCKLVVNTDTMEVRSLPTIEACRPPSKKYMPLSMPDGRWHFENATERDNILAMLAS